MEHLPSGAAARLVLTPNALHRHARRAQRELAALGIVQNLASSQEFLARVLGMTNWHEAHRLVQTVADGSTPLASNLGLSSSKVENFPAWPHEPATFDERDAEHLMLYANEQGFSNVTLQSDERVSGEQYGQRQFLTERALTHEEVTQAIATLHGTDHHVIARLNNGQDVDFSAFVTNPWGDRVRLRVNVTSVSSAHARGFGFAVTCHVATNAPPQLVHLRLPEDEAFHSALFARQGLVIVGGATGSGKTTLVGSTLREYVDHPMRQGRKIVTYEQPVEYVYDDLVQAARTQHSGTSWTSVSQIEIGRHLPSFKAGLKNALRVDPDVVMVGECRDLDTLEVILELAMTGHMVYTTMMANFVADVFRRLMSLFHEQPARGLDLVSICRLIVVQKLVPGTDGKRVALREYVVLDEAFVDALLDQPESMNVFVQERLDHQGTSFAHDARAKYAQGLIDERTLNRVLRMSASRGSPSTV